MGAVRGTTPDYVLALNGYTLTNGETYSKRVYLGINDSPDNWREIPDEEVPEEGEPEEDPHD